MTLIVYKDGVMASDSATWVGDIMVGPSKKVHKSAQGELLGCCGNASDIDPFERWFLAGKEGPPPVPRHRFTGLVVLRSGRMLVYSGGPGNRFDPHSTAGNFAAVGYGQEFALGCLCSGKSAVETIRMSVGRVAYIGGKVQSISLHSCYESRK